MTLHNSAGYSSVGEERRESDSRSRDLSLRAFLQQLERSFFFLLEMKILFMSKPDSRIIYFSFKSASDRNKRKIFSEYRPPIDRFAALIGAKIEKHRPNGSTFRCFTVNIPMRRSGEKKNSRANVMRFLNQTRHFDQFKFEKKVDSLLLDANQMDMNRKALMCSTLLVLGAIRSDEILGRKNHVT